MNNSSTVLKGLLLKESLEDISALGLVRITKTESWQVSNAPPYQPATWTALSFEAEEDQADTLAKKRSSHRAGISMDLRRQVCT